MNIKKSMIACAMLMAGVAANAQDAERTEYVFKPHWYIQLQGGAQHTLGEISFMDLISPNAQLGIGYEINKNFGLRLSANAWQSKAGWQMGNVEKEWKWNYVSPVLDLKVNLSNAFAGYNPNRLFTVSALAGVGANIAWGNDEAAQVKNEIGAYYNLATTQTNQNLQNLWDGTKARVTGRLGLAGDFRLSERVSAGLEVQANFLNDKYNSKKSSNGDWYFNALAGVKIALGKTHTTRTIPAPAPTERIIERIVEKPVERIVEKPVETKKVVANQLRRDVFFKIGKSEVVDAELTKVKEVAEFLKENPEKNVTITGAADKDTGTSAINKRLAAERAAAVKKILTETYGISESRITVKSNGDKFQPFSTPAENRVSICIAE